MCYLHNASNLFASTACQWMVARQLLCVCVCVQVKSIVFDKTGTLTHGVLRVSRVVMFVPRSDVSLRMVLAITGSAETSSEHPIGSAIASYVKKVICILVAQSYYALLPVSF